jgi:PIN domain nuclease of toxin-antitoxin system
MSDESLADMGKTLSSSFCKGLDRSAIKDAIDQRTKSLNSRETIAAVWGMTDDELVGKLADLGLDAETVAAISLTPLVEVAWADNDADKKERIAVLEAAAKYGLARGDVSYLLLEGRLGERPSELLFETWKDYLDLLARNLDPQTMSTLKAELMNRARNVAEASGGILGLGSKVSKAETEMLEKLEGAFP